MEVGRGQYEIREQRMSGQGHSLVREAGAISGVSYRPDGSGVTYRLLYRNEQGEAMTELRMVSATSQSPERLSALNADVFPFRANWLDNDTLIYTADGNIKKLVLDEVESTVAFSASFELNREPYERKRRIYDSEPQRVLGLADPQIDNQGKRVAFTAQSDIWLLDTDTGELVNLTDDGAE